MEHIRKRGTSIDATDSEIGIEANHVKRKVSQIDNLRHKFHEYQECHRKPNSITTVEESVLSAEEGPKRRKVSQIDVFRSKFLAYANNGSKGEAPNSFTPLMEQVKGEDNDKENKASHSNSSPRAESSDGEDLPRFSSSPPPHLQVKNRDSDGASKRENQKNAKKRSYPPQLTLGGVLQYCKLVTLTLSRMQGESWGIELVHVTVTGSSSNGNKDSKEDEKVVYVQHNGDGQNSIVDTSSIVDSSMDLINSSGTSSRHSPNSSESSEQEIASILTKTSHSLMNGDKSTDDMLQMVHKQNLRRRIGVTQGSGSNNFIMVAPDPNQILSRPSSASPDRLIKPLPQRPSSALAQWKKEGSPQPRPGVRIVALTEGGVAEASGELETDDLIIEVNKMDDYIYDESLYFRDNLPDPILMQDVSTSWLAIVLISRYKIALSICFNHLGASINEYRNIVQGTRCFSKTINPQAYHGPLS